MCYEFNLEISLKKKKNQELEGFFFILFHFIFLGFKPNSSIYKQIIDQLSQNYPC